MLDRVTRRLLLAAASLALVVAGCSTSDKPEPRPAPTTTTPAPTTEPPKPILSPLTGREVKSLPKNPVYVVKIDNTRPAAPQINLNKADLVVEEMVEGGVTRLAAMYHSKLPDQVGHIRSMRATDIGIAKPVNGQIVASGGAGVTINRIGSAGIPMYTQDQGNAAFWRDSTNYAPYNVNVDLKKLNKEAKGPKPQRPYLVWATEDRAATTGNRAARSATVKFSTLHTTTWEFSKGAWRRTNGLAGDEEFAAKNMLVLFADEADAGYRDPANQPVPETKFEGSGRAVVFIGRKAVEGTWKKPRPGGTLRLRNKAGRPIILPPGKVWIELVTKARGSIDY